MLKRTLLTLAVGLTLTGALVRADDAAPPRNPLTGDPITAPRQVVDAPPAQAGRLTIEQVGQALDAAYPGKNTVTNNGQTYYTITIKHGSWTYYLLVSLSPNGNVLWIDAPLVKLENPEAVSASAMLALLKKNTDMGPTFFQVNSNGMLEMTVPLPNHDMSGDRVGAEIEAFLGTIRDTQGLWKKETLMPGGGAAVATPDAPPAPPADAPRNPLTPAPAPTPADAPRNPLAPAPTPADAPRNPLAPAPKNPLAGPRNPLSAPKNPLAQ